MAKISRRRFAAGLAAGAGSVAALFGADRPSERMSVEASRAPQEAGGGHKRPIVISSANGYRFGATRVAYEKLAGGADTLDAVIAGVNMNELDPEDMSVGYGGLPNEEGEVTLDSCCMHGPTMQCGAVACLKKVKTPSLVAKAVMDHTDEIVLVGEDATRFAYDYGFELVDLLTDKARRVWMLWRETRSLRDSWGAGLLSPHYEEVQDQKKNGPALRRAVEKKAADLGIPPEDREMAVNSVLYPPHGTINCLGVNAKGEISGVTTTSGLAWKIAGRVGDSPILGAGCYVDGEVGGAGSTGRGEENIRIAGGHTVVEMMRQGKSPKDACLEALKRVQRVFRNFPDRLAKVDLNYYALRVDGAYGAASLWGPVGKRKSQFAVNDGENRLEDMAYLLEWTGPAPED
jgi:N4-(beta-N-acetylglucosaminyl)-L-asparaginase